MGIHPNKCFFCNRSPAQTVGPYSYPTCKKCRDEIGNMRSKQRSRKPPSAGTYQNPNALCKCGSGKKYRRCCKEKEVQLVSFPMHHSLVESPRIIF